VGRKVLRHEIDILRIHDIVYLSLNLIEERRLSAAELLGFEPLDVATGVLLDHDQVDDVNGAFGDQVLECRENLAAKLIARELDDDVFDRTNTHDAPPTVGLPGLYLAYFTCRTRAMRLLTP